MADTLPGMAETPALVAPIPNPPAGGQPPAVAPSPSAGQTAPLFNGNRGGRPRNDGLKPGSPEAAEADRRADKLRKRAARAKADPAPLPSAASGVAGAPPSPAGDLGAVPGVEGPPPLPWDAQMLKPLFEQLLPAVEQLSVSQITSRAAKARLPGELVAEIEKDAKWSGPAKKALDIAAPQVAAKWLNKTGISAENQAEVVLGTAVASILASHVLLLRRLDKIVAAQNVPTVKPGAKEEPAKAP